MGGHNYMQYKINIQTIWSWPNGHPQTMKMANPPLPPFRKGGMGGFENYFQCKTKTMLMSNPSVSGGSMWIEETG